MRWQAGSLDSGQSRTFTIHIKPPRTGTVTVTAQATSPTTDPNPDNNTDTKRTDDAMEILAMVEGLPAALTSVANVMKILAERSDSEFPLEKEVADGFNDIFGALMSAVAVAEDMGPLFRQVHEQDIARHEDPRNGHEAEKGWNV
ncbi:hypothetical protein ACFQ0G_22790 [Streptomyces chiangmaiensis]